MKDINSTSLLLDDDQFPIVAIASPPAVSAIAVVRLSGQRCHELLKKCILNSELKEWQANVMKLCKLIDITNKDILDEPLVVLYDSPRSYTGQDSAEVFLHGSPYIIQTVLSNFIKAGFRTATPGEFTRRAFLNGKMDLTKAEGVHELVSAASKQQWFAARQLMSGKLEERTRELRNNLVEAMAFLEAKIDFPEEEELTALRFEEICRKVSLVDGSIKKLMQTYESGRVSSQGLRVALVGPVNAGKSTLLNELLDKDRAIVTDKPGTTRDYLEESCLIDGRLIRLVDTAGLRDSNDSIEVIGIEKTKELLTQVDVVLLLVPSDLDERSLDYILETVNNIDSDRIMNVLTKEDLGFPSWYKQKDWISISCLQEKGIEQLKSQLAKRVDHHMGTISNEVFITSFRHYSLLEEAQQALGRFFVQQKQQAFEEMLAFELQQAAKSLVNIVGVIHNDDLLDSIFSKFCIGK